MGYSGPLSIIIVNYNSKDYLRRCLNSILETRDPELVQKVKIEIIVVDNGSSDGSADMIKKEFPEVKLIENEENLGFAAANNIGINRAATEDVLILNPDTEVSKNLLHTLLDIASRYKNLGALGSKILNPDRSLQFSCGCFPTLLNVIADRIPIVRDFFPTQLIRQKSFYESEQRPDWVSGVCLLLSKSAFKDVGGFDEGYFLYVEEVDLCYRLKKSGYSVVYTPQVELVHHYQGGSSERKKQKSRLMRKGLQRFFRKYRGGLESTLFSLLMRYF